MSYFLKELARIFVEKEPETSGLSVAEVLALLQSSLQELEPQIMPIITFLTLQGEIFSDDSCSILCVSVYFNDSMSEGGNLQDENHSLVCEFTIPEKFMLREIDDDSHVEFIIDEHGSIEAVFEKFRSWGPVNELSGAILPCSIDWA